MIKLRSCFIYIFYSILIDKMKDQIIAKICAQCEEYYSEATKLMEREPVMMCLDKEWTTYVSILIC